MRNARVAVIGAGISGLCVAIKLKRAGIEDVTIYEQADDLGGTWRDNTYPSLTCDVAARFYQYSFATNPNWSARYVPGAEIQNYLHDVADRYDLLQHCRFSTQVTAASWDGRAWRITTAGGAETTADFLIAATGISHFPNVPDFPGLRTFEGDLIHSALWDHGVELGGKNVGIIGNGASGAQIAVAAAKNAERVVIFQRSARWILPKFNHRYSWLTQLVHRRLPVVDRVAFRYREAVYLYLLSRALVNPGPLRSLVGAVARAYLRTVKDPELRATLTPDSEPLCKRMIFSSEYYLSVQRPHVRIVTEGISHVVPHGVTGASGRTFALDILILATGFDTYSYMSRIDITGTDGIKLADLWLNQPLSYHGVAVPCMPNFFTILGPFSPTASLPVFVLADWHAEFAIAWMRRWQLREFDSVAPSVERTTAFRAEALEALQFTPWSSGCTNTYTDRNGRPQVSPYPPAMHKKALRAMNDVDFVFEAAAGTNPGGPR